MAAFTGITRKGVFPMRHTDIQLALTEARAEERRKAIEECIEIINKIADSQRDESPHAWVWLNAAILPLRALLEKDLTENSKDL